VIYTNNTIQPTELADAQIEEFFDFAFKVMSFTKTNANELAFVVGTKAIFLFLPQQPLPHKEFQPENFISEVGNLKQRFNNPSNPNYLWKV